MYSKVYKINFSVLICRIPSSSHKFIIGARFKGSEAHKYTLWIVNRMQYLFFVDFIVFVSDSNVIIVFST